VRQLLNLEPINTEPIFISDISQGMNRFQRQTPTSSRTQPARRNDALSEQRYADLLKSASDFFATAFVASDDERQSVIIEINACMARYGLTAEDLL